MEYTRLEWKDYLEQQYKKAKKENLKMRINYKYEDGSKGGVFVDMWGSRTNFKIGQFSLPHTKLGLSFKPRGYSVYWSMDLDDIIEIKLLNKESK